MVAHVHHLQQQVLSKAVLQTDVPPQGIWILRLRIEELHRLAVERGQPLRRAHRLEDSRREGVRQRSHGRQKVRRHGELRCLAEALLSDDGRGGIIAVHCQVGDGDRRNKHAEAAANYGAVQVIGIPREAEPRAQQVGRVAVNAGIARRRKRKPAGHREAVWPELREWIIGVCRFRRSGHRVGDVAGEAVHGASEFLAVGRVMVEPQPDIEGEVAAHPPVILDEPGKVVRIVKARCIDIVLAGSRQSQQE